MEGWIRSSAGRSSIEEKIETSCLCLCRERKMNECNFKEAQG